MAQAGLQGFRQFVAQPAQMYAIIARLDAERGTVYAAIESAAAAASAADTTKKRKR
jgi:hypothetical protein